MRKEPLDAAEGMEILNQNSVMEFTLWPFSVILSNHKRLDTKHPSEATVNLFFFSPDSCQLLIRSHLGLNWGPDSKICRSDYETGRWEALKLKPAQMESDACSANRHQPTAGCLKASDLWELDGYGNCCLTGFEHTHGLYEYTNILVSGDYANTQQKIPIHMCCKSKSHTSTNSVSSVVHVGSCTLLFAVYNTWSTRESR